MAPYRARRRIRNPRRATTTSTTTATATTTSTTTTTDDDDDGDHSNNKNQESPQYSTTTTSEGLSKNGDGRDFDALEEDDLAATTTTPSGCCYSTPKAKRFRIPKISTCPPAPRKKQRLLPSNICSLRRSKPIAFFAPPDLELFFFFALPDIAV